MEKAVAFTDDEARRILEGAREFLLGLPAKLSKLHQTEGVTGIAFFLNATVDSLVSMVGPVDLARTIGSKSVLLSSMAVKLLVEARQLGLDVLGRGDFTVARLLGEQGCNELYSHLVALVNVRGQYAPGEIPALTVEAVDRIYLSR